MNTGNGSQTGWGHKFPVALSISHQLILSVAVDKKGKTVYIFGNHTGRLLRQQPRANTIGHLLLIKQMPIQQCCSVFFQIKKRYRHFCQSQLHTGQHGMG